MPSLLTRTAEKVLKVLLDNPLKEFKEIELIATARTGKGSAGLLINQLVKDGLVIKKMAGKTKMLSFCLSSPSAFFLKNLLDQQKLKQISGQRLAAAFFFKKEVENFSSLLILFGSTAAGTFALESDLDLLVVSQKMPGVDGARRKTEKLFGIRLNLHPYRQDEIRQKAKFDLFVQQVVLKGITLGGHDLAREIYSAIGAIEKNSLERIIFLKERIDAARRNLNQRDPESAQEIVSKTKEQLTYYLLTKHKIPYQSRKDAEKQIKKLLIGKSLARISQQPLEEQINLLEILFRKILIEEVLKGGNDGFAFRD